MSRARKVIDWDLVDNLCAIHCTGEEIAAVLMLNYDTLERACKRDKRSSFADYSTEKRRGGKASLRRRQWTQAEEGSVAMQIWLGKQWLGQSDMPSTDQSAPTIVINMPRTDGD